MAEIHDIERDPEFEAFLPLFKQKSQEPAFPEFSDDWLSRSPRIQWEGTTMVATEVKRSKTPYLAAAAALVISLSAVAFFFLQRGPQPPVVSHTGKLKVVVVYVKGDASRVDGTNKTALHSGDILKPGTALETGASATVDLAVEGGSIVRLRQNTRIVIATPVEPEKGVIIEQGTGETVHVVKKLDALFQHTTVSPTAIASVRGTVFEFTQESNGSIITVAEGKVEATGMRGKTETHIIEANRSIHITDDRDEPKSADTAQLQSEATEMRAHVAEFEEASSMMSEIKEVKNEEELKQAYQQEIELITLGDGRVLRGVVVAQSAGKLLVQTVGGSYFVSESDVRNIRYATESAH